MFTHQSVHAQSCRGSTSPWQHTLDTQCTCRSSRQSPWQRLRSTKRIWTWAPGRKSSPERTSSWTDEQSRRQGGGEREREWEWVSESLVVPVVVWEARPPVGCPQEGLKGTGQVHKQVTHKEEPGKRVGDSNWGDEGRLNVHMHTHVT